ncbi:nose resistant to fluoxetine protein 6-like [Papilio machaon]|uniref:nose resistant to fluoxetine protein 6-like n=1 Tax=Papilio machaon TaxID=76193 RepID=UPI001E664CE6|nr:nose resistant to fluoxetine protein 6-like [Papilio machaon]
MALNNTRLLAKFLDAGIRIPRGLFDDNSVDFGNYHQCLRINSPFEQTRILGKYCVIQVPLIQNFTVPGFSGENSTLENDLIKLGPSGRILLDKYHSMVNMYRLVFGTSIHNRTSSIYGAVLQMAACVPRACTTDDAITALLFNTSAYGFEYGEEYCRLPNDKPWVTVDSVALVVFSTIGVLTGISTFYEIVYIFMLNRKTNTCLRMFSIYSNTKSLLRSPQSEGNIKCLEGIKTVAMILNVIGHSINSVSYLQNPTYYFVASMNLTRENFRTMILYDFRCHLSQQECYDRLRLAFHDEDPSRATVYNWFNEFKCGRTNLNDALRQGQPSAATTEVNISVV